jgi:hypothetical protein
MARNTPSAIGSTPTDRLLHTRTRRLSPPEPTTPASMRAALAAVWTRMRPDDERHGCDDDVDQPREPHRLSHRVG